MAGFVEAPFSKEQVNSLTEYQQGERPYLCSRPDHSVLVPVMEGLKCSVCGHLQVWAHPIATNFGWKQPTRKS